MRSGGTSDRQISPLCTRLGLDPHHSGHTYHVVIFKYDPGSPVMKAAKDEVSALMWLRSKRLSVPIILAYAFSKNNEINSPYIVESICSGRPAGQIYGGLCLQEKKQVLDAVADAIAQMKSTTFAHWSKLVSSSSNDLSAPKYRRGRVQDNLRLKASLRVEEEMTLQFADVLTVISRPDMVKPVSMQRNYAEQLEEATAQMAEDPFFMSTAFEDFCLCFRGLLPDNIILAKIDDENWKVSITCRDVWSMTEIIASPPLSWLWGGAVGSAIPPTNSSDHQELRMFNLDD